MPTKVGAVTARVAVCVFDPRVPVIMAVKLAATAVVETVNAAEVWPAATVTEDGTVTPVLLLERTTTRPAAGAALDRLTVPLDDVPPTTEDGLSCTLMSVGAVTVSGAVWVVEPSVPLMMAFTVAATAVVETVKLPEV